MKKWFFLFVGCLISIGWGWRDVEAQMSIKNKKVLPANFKLIAHRGASAHAPENTLESTLLAYKQGADAAECDVQLTKDGEIIFLHDDTLLRTTGTNKRPSELTWDDIKNLDAGSWFAKNGQWSFVRIPRLVDVLVKLGDNKLVIEIKEKNPVLVDKLVELVKKNEQKLKLKEKLLFISFHHELLEKFKLKLPQYPAYYLTTYRDPDAPVTNKHELVEMIKKAKMHNIDGLDFEWAPSVITKENMELMKVAGLKSIVWVYAEDDTIENIRATAAAGVEYFTTNKPLEMRKDF